MRLAIAPMALSFLIALITTPIIIKIAPKVGAIDIPKDDRRIHNKPIPLIGGVAIFAAIMIGLFVFFPHDRELFSIFLGGLVVLIGGIKDDIKGTSPKEKLAYQIVGALIAIYGGLRIDFISNPFSSDASIISLGFFSIPITIIWIVGISNALNLIDGLDGLTAGVASICSISFMLVAFKLGNPTIGVISACIAGGCLGFLPFNFNPAKIFMGDTGSLFLGYMLAIVSIEGVMKSVAAIAMLAPIIILGVPIFDTAFAILRRLFSGKSISTADRGHLHHRLLDRGFNQKQTVLILYAISIVFGTFAVISAKVNSKQAVYLSIVLLLAAILLAIKIGMFSENKGGKNK